MLFADKQAVGTTLSKQLLEIRERELDYYVQNCQAISFFAALVSGFAWSGFTQVAVPDDTWFILKFAYLGVTASSMCFELIAIMSVTLLALMAPGLALRGPDGSVDTAVTALVEEYRGAYQHFYLGLVFFFLSNALYAWLSVTDGRHAWISCLFSSSTSIGMLYVLYTFAKRVFARFRLSADEVVSGRFLTEEESAALWRSTREEARSESSRSAGKRKGSRNEYGEVTDASTHGQHQPIAGLAYSQELLQLVQS